MDGPPLFLFLTITQVGTSVKQMFASLPLFVAKKS
jgi:hypothetical protein